MDELIPTWSRSAGARTPRARRRRVGAVAGAVLGVAAASMAGPWARAAEPTAAPSPSAAAPANAPGPSSPTSPLALSNVPWAPPVRPSAAEARSLSCPVTASWESAVFTVRGRPYEYRTAREMDVESPGWQRRLRFDGHAFDGLVAPDTNVVAIDVRRVQGEPAYAYFGQGGLEHEVYEPWSSSKLQAASAALARLRQASGGAVGGDGRIGKYAIGDLVTAMHAYAPVGEVTATSNGIGAFFLLTAGADFTTRLFGPGWLNLEGDDSRFRGLYGVPAFDPESSTWAAPDGTTVERAPSRDGVTGDKLMSAFAQAEWLRRIVMHEAEPAGRLPGLTNEDVATLLYGSKARSGELGGMSAGVSTYLAAAVTGASSYDEARIALSSIGGPRWRIFHKVGWGDSGTRNRSEVVTVGYVCLPDLDGGREIVVALRTSLPGAPGVPAAGEAHQAALSAVLGEMLAGGPQRIGL